MTRPFAALLIALLVGCAQEAPRRLAAEQPNARPIQDLASVVDQFAYRKHLSVSGVAFMGGRLFVGTNVGLVEVQGREAKALYTWTDRYNVVSGPWSDPPRGALWAFHDDAGFFMRLDGNGWQKIALPAPPKGYYSRGDMLSGFSGASDAAAFRIVGAGAVSRREADAWVPEPAPPAGEFNGVMAFARAGPREVHLVGVSVCTLDQCDLAAYWREDGRWRAPLVLVTPRPRELLGTNDGVFMRDVKDGLHRIELDRVVRVQTPGPCEAIAVTSGGKLVASFRGVGIHVWSGNWTKLHDDPYTAEEREHWAYLAESNGMVALGTGSVPHLKPGTDNQWVYSGTDAVWVSDGAKLTRVKLDER